VVDHLRQCLSPAQIASTLARMPDPVWLNYETIYTALYTMPRGHLRFSLLSLIRRRHRAKRPHRGRSGRSKPSIPDRTLIDQRPIEVQMRLFPGRWEGDLIIGKGNLSQVGTLVELDSSKADVTAEAFTKVLNCFDSQLRRSMTYDQGSEMRHHKTLTANTGVDVYFAHPHASWERGINENTNGLLHQYLSKVTDLHCSRRSNWATSQGDSRSGQEDLLDGKRPLNCSYQKEPSTSYNTGQLKLTPLHLYLESAPGQIPAADGGLWL